MANLDRKALDAARKMNNLAPITDEEFASLKGNGQSEEEKAAQLKLQQEEESKKKKEEKKPEPAELSDEELLEKVAQKTGRKLSSFDDLKEVVKEEDVDKAKVAEERESAKFAWGLQNKRFKPKEFENFIAASKDPKELVYNIRLQAAKKEDPNLDEKEFAEEFAEEFGLEAKTDSRRYKNGQDTLNRLAESVLKTTYAPIYNLENDYSSYEQTQKANAERQNKVKTATPEYKKTLDVVKGQLKKIKTKINDSDEYEIEALDESINEVVDMMSDPQWTAQQIINGYTQESLQDIAFTTILKKNWPLFANEIAKQHLKKHAAGTKGILTIGKKETEEVIELTDSQQKLATIIKENTPVPATAN